MTPCAVAEVGLATVSDAELDRIAEFKTACNAALAPDDPPLDRSWARSELHPGDDTRRLRYLTASDTERVVGMAELRHDLGGTNANLSYLRIEMLAGSYDRCALDLIRAAAEIARADGRTSLVAWGTHTAESAGLWSGLGLPLAMLDRTSRLAIADVDMALMERWRSTASAKSMGYTVHRWEGPCPDDMAPLFLAAQQGMMDAPLDDLDIEHPAIDEAWNRGREKRLRDRGAHLRVVMATDPDGASAAMTEVVIYENRPWFIDQEGTTTLALHRNRGLGRWLKAEMLLDVVQEHPEARVIETGNADSNAPMRSLNDEMGFRPHCEVATYQAPTADVIAAVDEAIIAH